jgi:hypothetical protein
VGARARAQVKKSGLRVRAAQTDCIHVRTNQAGRGPGRGLGRVRDQARAKRHHTVLHAHAYAYSVVLTTSCDAQCILKTD